VNEGERTKNDAILELLEAEGPLSTHQIVERLNERGVRMRSTGQALTRLRGMLRREEPLVEEVEGERGRLWKLS
jgi:hypothetical protein